MTTPTHPPSQTPPQPRTNPILVAAGLFGCAGIGLGAFGAHALKHHLSPDQLAVWHTGVQYQLYHSLGLLLLGLYAHSSPQLKRTAACWGLGIMLFSGSLYALALGAPHRLGLLTPVGGVLFMVGWLSLISVRSKVRAS